MTHFDVFLLMLNWVLNHGGHKNLVGTSVTHSAAPRAPLFLHGSHPHFDVIRDLLLNRRTTTWNLFSKWLKKSVEC